MGLGSTAKKLQKVVDAAEQLYAKMNDVLDRLENVREDLAETTDRVEGIEREVAEQRALVEALAEREGVDVDAVLAEADVADPDAESAPEGEGEAADEQPDRTTTAAE